MNGVLVDTSVWVDHFRQTSPALTHLLVQNLVWTHSMVLGELACGGPPAPRSQTLADIACLQRTDEATTQEVLDFIESEQLHGLGCGWVDMVLLTSALITPGATLWTLDKRLAALADRFAVLQLAKAH
jgi:predicted nucleic acid-binding protein